VHSAGTSEPDNEALLDSIGPAFSRLRRRGRPVSPGSMTAGKDLSRNLIINIVDEASDEMTVGGIADQLAVDPSVASRMVSDCISSGYLRRMASQRDGRRTVLELTPEGVALRDLFRTRQRQMFEYITREWPDSERLEFARLLLKYAECAESAERHGLPDYQ
jgi:DNA-binding MarR family transcriptional regulator